MAEFVSDSTKLKACPFCGGEAKRITLEQPEEHAGGDVIYCTGICGASSHIEFGRKENLVSLWNTRAAPPAMDREAVERATDVKRSIIRQLSAQPYYDRVILSQTDWDIVLSALSTLSADAIRQGEGEALALRAIKAVTATAKDGAAGLSRIMAIASAAGVKQQYSELLQEPYVALIVDRPRTEWAHLFKPGVEGCAIPPEGWQCSRARGHSGPCAATPASHASDGVKSHG